MVFERESDLFDVALKSNYISEMTDENTFIESEVKGLFGIPDLLISKTDDTKMEVRFVFACEMKLSNWKRALSQAYRYRSFANVSCVMMDDCKVKPAISNIDKFKDSKVGLLSIKEDGEVITHYIPPSLEPVSKRLSEKNQDRLLNN